MRTPLQTIWMLPRPCSVYNSSEIVQKEGAVGKQRCKQFTPLSLCTSTRTRLSSPTQESTSTIMPALTGRAKPSVSESEQACLNAASQPHCRRRYSQHRNPIAEVVTASQPQAQVTSQASQPQAQVPSQASQPQAQVPSQASQPQAQVTSQASQPQAQVTSQAYQPGTHKHKSEVAINCLEVIVIGDMQQYFPQWFFIGETTHGRNAK